MIERALAIEAARIKITQFGINITTWNDTGEWYVCGIHEKDRTVEFNEAAKFLESVRLAQRVGTMVCLMKMEEIQWDT